MSDTEPQSTPEDPTSRQVRDARREAHDVQKHSASHKGGEKKDRKGKSDKKASKGRGDPKP